MTTNEIPVRLLRRTGGLYLLSVPKKYSNVTFDKGLVMKVGEKYIVEKKIKKPAKIVEPIERIKPKNDKGIPIHISMDRDFAENIIDKEYPEGINEMDREAKINELAEVLEFFVLRYDEETNKITLEEDDS